MTGQASRGALSKGGVDSKTAVLRTRLARFLSRSSTRLDGYLLHSSTAYELCCSPVLITIEVISRPRVDIIADTTLAAAGSQTDFALTSSHPRST